MHLHYRKYGSGPVLILLHGLFGSLNIWHSHARAFSSRFTVYAVDQRNHGMSPHDPDSSYPAMAEDIHTLMNVLGISDAVLLGHSMGGKTAIQFGGMYPGRANALVIVDIAPRGYPEEHGEIFRALHSINLETLSQREEADRALIPFIDDSSVRRFLVTNIVRDARGHLRWRMNLPVLRESYGLLAGPVDLAAPFLKPALFIRGERSSHITPEDEGPITQLFPAAKFLTLPGAGHWVPADVPELFQKVVLEFLS